MHLNALATRNVTRNKFRTAATIVGVAVAVVAFILLRTVVSTWSRGAEDAAQDRIAIRHKVGFVMPLPIRYLQDVRQIEGVESAVNMNWFGAKHATREREFFANMATDPKAFLDVYREVDLPAAQAEAWIQNRKGAVVGRLLAKKFGWKVGDRVKLRGTIYPGDWDFEISGIFDSDKRSVDLSSFLFHYDYLNQELDPRLRDWIGWVAARVSGAGKAATVSRAIDAHFEDSEVQTISMSERALSNSFMGMFGAILGAMDIVSIVILLIMMLILGNTVAMGVRERTHEYGVLRAMGFMPRHLVRFILGEAATIGILGGVLGLLLSYPIVEQGIGRFLEENMRGFFPFFRIQATTAIMAIVFSVCLGIVAAVIPAYRASKLDVVDSLRTTG